MEKICPVCEANVLITEAELIEDACDECRGADEALGGEQDFDERLFAQLDLEEEY